MARLLLTAVSHLMASLFAISIVAPQCHADESTVSYDTSTGYILSVEPNPTQSSEASTSGSARALRTTARTLAAPTTASGILVLQHGAQSAPDPDAQKVDISTLQLVENDRIEVSAETLVMPAGSGETRAVLLTKVTADGELLSDDTSAVWVGLAAVVDGQVAAPGTPLGRTLPAGRIAEIPTKFRDGVCRVVIRAASRSGRDCLIIRQQGVKERRIGVYYE